MSNVNPLGWMEPTVGEVQTVLELISEKLGLDSYKQFHAVLGIGERSMTRWRDHANESPDLPSSIRKHTAMVLWSFVTTPPSLMAAKDLTQDIDHRYLFSAENYQCPDESFFKAIIGQKALLGMTKKEVAAKLRLASNKFGSDIKQGKVSYITYCALLMLCGFRYWQVFNVEPDAQAKKMLEYGEGVTRYLNEKRLITEEANRKLAELAQSYLKQYPDLANNDARGLPAADLKKLSENVK